MNQNNMKQICLGLAMITFAPMSGCYSGTEPGETSSATAQGSVGADRQAIIGGTEVTEKAVVYLGGCTGVLINGFTILTAAHCFPGHSSGSTSVNAVYISPTQGYLCLTGGDVTSSAGSNPRCAQPADMQLSLGINPVPTSPDWVANADDDLAILVSTTFFNGVSTGDYALIDMDTLKGVDRLQEFGYGANSESGGWGVLRTSSAEVDDYKGAHLSLIGRGGRGCTGDSGGPATIYTSQTPDYLDVVGLLSNVERGNNLCDDNGGTEYYVRLSSHIPFIQAAMGAGPYTNLGTPNCSTKVIGTGRRSALDCDALYW